MNNVWKKIGRGLRPIGNLFGFNKDSKYVNNYIMHANVRSGVFMAAVIVIIEVWMIYRQFDKYLIPGWIANDPSYPPGLHTVFVNTSGFWLFLFVGLCVFTFSLCYNDNKMAPKTKLILNLAFAGASLLYSGIGIFFENYSAWTDTRRILSNSLLIAIYVLAFLLSAGVIFDTLLTYFKKKSLMPVTVAVVALFAAMCFAFGIKVSYSDFTSSNHKQIICFLTMAVYGTCLLIWKPYISIIINVALFTIFYQLIANASIKMDFRAIGYAASTQEMVDSATYYASFKDGDLVNYITFVISATMVTISIYHQRRNEAIKDEELEYLANYDELSGLHNFQYFVRTIQDKRVHNGKVILFMNIVNFKILNDQRGFEAGNEFLRNAGKEILKAFPGCACCRQSDDHFLVYDEREGLEEKLAVLTKAIHDLDPDVGPLIHTGFYAIKDGEDARRASDKARYACSTLGKDLAVRICEYDQAMHDGFHLMQHVIRSIDKAVEENWVRPYYQPVVWSKDGKLCGVEALARWIDPKRGMLPPGKFVPTLESTKLVHKLDAAILVAVCRDIRRSLDAGLPTVPVSINFSRLDFELMDIVGLLEETVAKYNIPKDYLHVEITESALADDEGLLADNIRTLKAKGYALWLDDFGSGYSSLNVLKDFDFDVMKIDMKFLVGFENNAKAAPLLEAVISMANRLGMRTLTEGVETEQETQFLTEAKCERLQGYFFGKPISYEDLYGRIEKGELKVSENLL